MQYYDHLARGYTELYGEEQARKYRIVNERLQPRRTQKLLDVGCGDGPARIFDCQVHGIDPSRELLNVASIPVDEGYAEALPYADNTFDIVICITVLQNLTDTDKALREMRRVGCGIFVISFLKRSPHREFFETTLRAHFTLDHVLEEEKDSIFFLH